MPSLPSAAPPENEPGESSSPPPRWTRSVQDIYAQLNVATASNPLEQVYPAILTEDDSLTVEEALSGPDATLWRQAMDAEFQALQQNSTWSLVKLPPDRRPITCKWILRRKLKADGSIERYKARLVARGFSQSPGLDFDETFSPVLGMTAFCILVALAAHYDWPLHQLDVKTAFLHGDLQEEIYMQQPPLYQSAAQPDTVCRLHKALYGLKQSPRQWYLKIHQFLLGQGYIRLQSDPNIYTRHSNTVFLVLGLYVDDILLLSNQLPELNHAKRELSQTFPLTDGGELSYCLGIQVKRDHQKGVITLSRSNFVDEILHRYNMMHCNGVPIPLAPSTKLSSEMAPSTDEEKRYMQGIPSCNVLGSIRYLVTCTRPDLCFAAGFLSRFMQ